jgi:hypothetical protein
LLRGLELDKQIAEEQQGKFRAKAKKAISRLLPKWLSERIERRDYSQWLQIKHAELTVQALELQIISLNLELKASRETRARYE